MTDPHREDWLWWQRQTPGEQHQLRWSSHEMHAGGEDYPGLWNQTSQQTMLAKIGCVRRGRIGCLQLERDLVVQANWCSVTAEITAVNTPLMGTPARTLDKLNKVVVGFLNGNRIKGYVHEFSARKRSFDLLPQEDPLQKQGIKVALKDIKAVFFVSDFTGNPEYQDSPPTGVPKDGRTIEVTFTDGERIVGRPVEYDPQRSGFFMFPADTRGNNIRIFVVARNTRQVRLL